MLIASIALHLFAFDWASGRIGMPSWHDQPSEAVIMAELRPAPAGGDAIATARSVPPRSRSTAKPRPMVPMPQPTTSAITAEAAPAAADMEVSGTNTEAVTEPPPTIALAKASGTASSQEAGAVRYKISPPPSAELKYDVQALREGQTVYGRGKIGWQSEGSHYTVTGEAGILFFTVLNFKSEGLIDDFGVAPVLYSEKRFRKSETNTHFHRERNTISFSASTASYPRTGGEQDRASIIWQLAGIGRGDSKTFAPGAEIDLFVAGVRDAETWHIRVLGEEEIEVGSGKTITWHVVRTPRPGSYEQKLDIWLAPRQEWFPVKLRYTETNGDYLDMSLSNAALLPAR